MHEIFSKNSYDNVFLKIDIEGSEYRILDQLIENQKKINGLVIEFHDCDLHFDRINRFIQSFELDLVHIHVNNYSYINYLSNPAVIELTFCKKKYSYSVDFKKVEFPNKKFDAPNNKHGDNPKILFY